MQFEILISAPWWITFPTFMICGRWMSFVRVCVRVCVCICTLVCAENQSFLCAVLFPIIHVFSNCGNVICNFQECVCVCVSVCLSSCVCRIGCRLTLLYNQSVEYYLTIFVVTFAAGMPFPPQVFVRLVSLLGQLPALEQLNIGCV